MEELDSKIGMTTDPESVAMEMLREHQRAMGMEITPETEKPEFAPEGDEYIK
jgi:hypothetical protein